MIPELLAGAVLFGGGTLFGAILRSLPARRRTPHSPELICTCEDGYGTHDEKTGKCNGSIKRPNGWKVDRFLDRTVSSYEYVPCPCLKYDGPIPIETYTARTIALPAPEQEQR